MEWSFDVAQVIVISFAALLVADLISGVVHWLEDSYGKEGLPVLGRLVTQANVIHHFEPRHMTYHSWLSSARGPIFGAAIALVVAYFVGLLTWPVVLVAVIAANANEIHKWAHRSKTENGRLITLVQSTGLFQTRAHHARHHRPQERNYCGVTNYLNPVLEMLRFWRLLESTIYLATRVQPREDPSTTPQRLAYAVPACSDAACLWLKQHQAAEAPSDAA